MKKITGYLERHWLAIILLISGLYFQVFQICGFDLERVAGDLGDTRFILAIVEYNYQWLTGSYSDYWDGFFMFPDKEVISYSDNLLGTLPFYAVFRVCGADYLQAFQLLVLLCHILNFTVTYFCFLRLGHRPLGAALGAFCFAFNLGVANLYNHPQFSFRFVIPIFFLCLDKYLREGRPRLLLFTVLALVYQFYLTIYIGYFLVLCGGVYLIAYSVVHTRNFHTLKKQGLDALKVAPLGILLLLPLMYFYIKRGLTTGYYNDYDFYMQHVPRLSSYLKAFDSTRLWTSLRQTDVYSKYSWQHELFPGITVFIAILAAIVLVFKGNRVLLVLLLSITIFVSFTTYYDGHTMYGFLMKIPGLKAVRVVGRFYVVLVFFAAWLISNQGSLLQNSRPLVRILSFCLLPLLMIIDNATVPDYYRYFSKTESLSRVQHLQLQVEKAEEESEKPASPDSYREAGRKVLAFLNPDTVNIHFHHLDAMLCALQNGRKTVNGYSSSCGRYFGPFWRKPDRISLRFWCRQMALSQDSVLVLEADRSRH